MKNGKRANIDHNRGILTKRVNYFKKLLKRSENSGETDVVAIYRQAIYESKLAQYALRSTNIELIKSGAILAHATPSLVSNGMEMPFKYEDIRLLRWLLRMGIDNRNIIEKNLIGNFEAPEIKNLIARVDKETYTAFHILKKLTGSSTDHLMHLAICLLLQNADIPVPAQTLDRLNNPRPSRPGPPKEQGGRPRKITNGD